MTIKSEHLLPLLNRAVSLGVPANGLDQNGVFSYSVEPTANQLQQAQSIIASYDEVAEDALIANAENTKKAAFGEVAGDKLALAISTLKDDIAAFDSATAAQRLAMQKRLMQRQLGVLKALGYLIPN